MWFCAAEWRRPMYKLIIVEDESQMNRQLTKILDWENIGFEIVHTFENGADAMDYINKNHVDAVLTDIRVPVISGVELSKICHSEHPRIKFVFISAFRNFEYARSAIKYNVVDYITKPITYNDFFNAMVALYNEVDKNNHISTLQERNDFIEDEIAFMRQEYLSSYILGVIDLDTLIYHLSQIGIVVDKDNCSCAKVNIKIKNFEFFMENTWTHERERFYSTINKFITPENDYAFFSVSQFVYDSIEVIVLGKKCFDDDVFEKSIDEYFRTVKENMKTILQMDVEINVTQQAQNPAELKKYRISKNSAAHLCAMVMSYIHSDSPAEAARTVQIVRKIFSSDAKQAEKFCRTLFSEIMPLLKNSDEARIEFLAKNDVSEMFNFLNEKISDMKNTAEDGTDNTMERAIEYIKQHYTENITLADAAKYVALSPGYFSSVFKQYTNEKFIDYLSRLRINKAMEMLVGSNIKITAIANLVGYKDAQYFHRVFKLYSGTTPSKYRADHGKE